jgi:hypothetical protein
MLEAEFWELIERARAPRIADAEHRLERELEALPDGALVGFDAIASAYFWAIDRRELWAAADAIRAGCLDEAWDRFRQWLLLQGEDVVARAIRDPDSLADLAIDEEPRCERLLPLARTIYKARTGADLPRGERHVVDRAGWPPDRMPDYSWTDADTERLFPRLTAMAAWRHFARC